MVCANWPGCCSAEKICKQGLGHCDAVILVHVRKFTGSHSCFLRQPATLRQPERALRSLEIACLLVRFDNVVGIIVKLLVADIVMRATLHIETVTLQQ